MRIDHTVDSAHGQTHVHHRPITPPAIAPLRRIQGVNQGAVPEDGEKSALVPGEDGISLDLSPEAREAARLAALQVLAQKVAGESPEQVDGQSKGTDAEKTDAEKQEARKQANEEALREQERARATTAGNLAVTGATYSYRRGPDGRLYAVGGEVSVDTSAIPGDPEGTLRKAEQLRRAALRPGNPSPQDLAVASLAAAMAARARAEIARQEAEANKQQEEPHAVNTRQ